jgi:hypothetical protein
MRNFSLRLIPGLGRSRATMKNSLCAPPELQKRGTKFELQDHKFRTLSTFTIRRTPSGDPN